MLISALFLCSTFSCQFGPTLFNFDHKGIVRVPCHELQSSSTDPLDLAIEVGAEDVTMDSDDPEPEDQAASQSSQDGEGSTEGQSSNACFQFKCEPKEIKSVSDAIKERSFTISSASFEYIPKSQVALERVKYNRAVRLLELLSDQDGVIEIYDNFVLEKE